MAKASTLDPVLQDILAQPGDPNATPVEEQTPEEARAEFAADMRAVDGPQPEIAESKDFEIPGPGGSITLRSYLPDGMQDAGPLLVYYHGGGNIRGSIETHDSTCRVLANAGCFAVLSVDYRLAPEHRFPAAVEDAYAAAGWAAENAGRFGCDAGRLAVGGDSAGGNLAAATSLLAQQTGAVSIAFQLLIYPVIDLVADNESRRLYSSGYLLNSMPFYTRSYVPDLENRRQPLASPIHAESHAGLPPALVLTAGFDPLHDEGEAYAEALRAAGVPVDYFCFESMIHGFVSLRGLVPQAEEGLRRAARSLNATIGS